MFGRKKKSKSKNKVEPAKIYINSLDRAKVEASKMVKQDLEALKSLKVKELVDQEEFSWRLEEISTKYDEYKLQILIEEEREKLEDIFSQGSITVFEYEEKLILLNAMVKNKIGAYEKEIEEYNKQKEYKDKILHKLAKLQSDQKSGLIMQQEYNAKLAQLRPHLDYINNLK